MPLTPITAGDDVSATPLNNNFNYLAGQISDTNTALTNAVSSLQSSISSAVSSIDTQINAVFSALYPVGALYITSSSAETCPIASLIADSEWELVASGRVLQGSDASHAAGTTIAAGLPNITGTAYGNENTEKLTVAGCFYTWKTNGTPPASGDGSDYGLGLNAANSSSIYGNSTTVQPPAYVVNIWRRTL